MTTRGRLDDVSLPDLLQVLSSGRRTGKLTLSNRNGYGVLLVRDGRVIYAASNRTRQAFGSILTSRGLVSEETLCRALEVQNEAPEERRLGSILLDMGAVSHKDLREAMRYQVGEVLRDFLSWKEAYFKFLPGTIPDRGEVGVDFQDLVLDEGLTAEGVLVDVVRRSRSAPPEAVARLRAATAPDVEHPDEPLSLVRAMTEVRSPAFTGEISLRILSYAAQVLGRGVLFSIGRNLARGTGQFGIELDGGEPTEERIRRLELPLDQDSVIARAASSQETERGRPERTPWNEHLAEALGGVMPPEVVAIPLTVNGATAFVLYGDDLPNPGPIGSLEALEGLIIQAGLAMEKAALERRLSEIPPEREPGGAPV
jgi:hypothetical protein